MAKHNTTCIRNVRVTAGVYDNEAEGSSFTRACGDGENSTLKTKMPPFML